MVDNFATPMPGSEEILKKSGGKKREAVPGE
jgi:hypothetical protein